MIRRKDPIRTADFYFYHGWAFPPGVWNSVINQIKSSLPNSTGINPDFYVNNRGYFSDPSAIVRMRQGDLQIVIAHSLGLHFVPVSLLHKADILISISGFHDFHEIGRDVSMKVMDRMIKQFDLDPVSVLKEFYTKVFSPTQVSPNYLVDDPANMRTSRLMEDLLFLNSSRLSDRIFPESCQIYLFHGDKDHIVSVDHTRKWMMGMNQTSGRIVMDAGHALPVSHSDEIVQGVTKVIHRIIESS
jgi:pimeloyl-[acyl-carrier protein] methyl ester esterase